MPNQPTRREALSCLGLAAGTLFSLAGGVLTAAPLAQAQAPGRGAGRPLFVQISDTHIGFNRPANPDPGATLDHTIDLINAMPERPALVLHTGDVTQLAKAEEFDQAQQHLARLKVSELHATPGEHDAPGGQAAEFFARFGKPSRGRGYYSFDHDGVHFVCLANAITLGPEASGTLGADQIAWLKDDLSGRSRSQPLVVFAHMPLWNVYEPWGWTTGDGEAALELLRPFGSVAVLNGHIHQIVQKTEGHIVFHTARSTAFPQPAPGEGPGPGPLAVPPEELPRRLGLTSVRIEGMPSLTDTTLA